MPSTRSRRFLLVRFVSFAVAAAGCAWLPPVADADSDVTSIQRGLLPAQDGRWGLGVGLRLQESPYRGQSPIVDLLPLLSYEGEKVYLRGTRAGWYLVDRDDFKLEVIGQFRLNRYTGEPEDYLAGMTRERAFEGGASAIFPTGLGEWSVEAVSDLSSTHKGQEVSLAWARSWTVGDLTLRPSLSLNYYSRALSNYYYGVEPGEARPDRPAYAPGASNNLRLGLHASYRVTTNSYLYGSFGVNRFDGSVSDSPIIDRQAQFTLFGGYLYRFGGATDRAADAAAIDLDAESRWSLRVAGGWAAKESLLGIIAGNVELAPERTGIVDLEVGKLLNERFLDLPIDIYVKGAYKRFLEQNLQPDFGGYALYIKGFWYGFPWSDRVRTRIGFGEGLSYVERIPILERQNLERKNPNTSQLLNYLDVSLDVSVGDLFGVKRLKETYFGFAVIHRSGIFGFADLFGNVNGGSNYNTLYIETVF
ncbi:MAG: MipA/OmpV family protein [Burkholderiales bacterium]|nr:MipA/OmpV family protein [Burkholderiales bacterium]